LSEHESPVLVADWTGDSTSLVPTTSQHFMHRFKTTN